MSTHLARSTDPATSQLAAEQLTTAQTHCRLLLEAYATHPEGLTDYEACALAGLPREAHKRCSDLRRLGAIVFTGRTRLGEANRLRSVSSLPTIPFREDLFG